MEGNHNDISTLINILSINFPIQYPHRETSDQLDTFLPGIAFPNYSLSQINKITANSSSIKQFKDILDDLHFYFPLVPDILNIISNYQQPMIEEVLDYCACIVICSYVSWRIYSEFNQTLQYIQYLFDSLPIVSNSHYSLIISSIYCDCLNYYLVNQNEFDLKILKKSLENLLFYDSKDIFNQIGPIFFKIISTKIGIQPNMHLNDEQSYFIEYLGKVTEKYPKIFDINSTIQIITLLHDRICQLDTNALHLFSNLCNYMPIDTFDSIFSILFQSLADELLKIQFPSLPSIENDSVIQFSNIGFSDINDEKLFEENSQISIINGTFSIKQCNSSPISFTNYNQKIGYYFPNDFLIKLTYLSNVIQSKSRNIDALFEFFQSHLHEPNYFYSLVYIVSNLQLRRQQIETYYSILISSDYFQSNYSSFKGDNSMMNQFRFEMINSISHFPNIYEFLLQFSERPLLYSEILHFLYPYIPTIVNHNFLAINFLMLLCRSFIFFQKLNITEKDSEKLEIIESTRICILQLISRGLNNSETENVWDFNQFFNNFIFNMLFELSIREFIINQIQHCLINFYHTENNSMVMNLNNIIERSIESHDIDLLIDLINMINIVLQQRSESADLFFNIINIFVNSLKKIDNSSKSHYFFLQLLKCLSFIRLNDSQFEILNETVKRLKSAEFSSQIQESLFKLISGIHMTSKITPLVQPKIIILILENCCNYESLAQFLSEDLYPLLKDSLFNCVQAYKGGIESYLFSKFLEFKNQDLTKINIVKDIFNILNTIHYACSSSQTAKNVIQVFEPIDSRHISHFCTFYIQSLKSMFQNPLETPKSYLPLSSKLEIYNLKSSIFEKSFEIAFWIYIEPFTNNDTTTQIVFLSDSKGKGINISFSLNKIIVRYIKKHEEILQFDADIPCSSWHLISLIFQLEKTHQLIKHNSGYIESHRGSISFRSKFLSKSLTSAKPITITSFNSSFSSNSPNTNSNNKKSSDNSIASSPNSAHSSFTSGDPISKTKTIHRTFSVFLNIDNNISDSQQMNMRTFCDKTISMAVGTVDDLYPLGYFSCVSIFPYLNHPIKWNSLKLVSSEDPILSVTFDLEIDNAPKAICETNPCAIIPAKAFVEIPTPLSIIFMNEMKISSLTLLFAEFDFLTLDNNKIQSFPEMTVELFVAFLQSGKAAQVAFIRSGCCDAIGHLLSLTDPSNLKYNTYLRFASVIKSFTVQKCKHTYLKKIVLNLNIWGRCNIEILRSITSFWVQELYEDTSSVFSSILNYPSLLFIIGKFSYDEKVLNNIYQLILKSVNSFTADKFSTLISFCIENKNVAEIRAYLEIIKRILTETAISDEIISKKMQNISLLINLIGMNDTEIFIKVIDIIIICHRNNLFKQLTLNQHLELVLNTVKKENVSIHTLKSLLEKANINDPELYPMCCMIALHLGKEGIEYLAHFIQPSKFFGESPYNLMWLIMIICTSEDTLREEVFTFLFDDSIIKIEDTTTLIEIICVVFDHSPDHQLIPFLSQGFTMIAQHTERFKRDCVHKILKAAYHALLFRSKHAIQKWMTRLVEKSPFSTSNESQQKTKIGFSLSLIDDDINDKDFDNFDVNTIFRRINEIRSSKIQIAFQFWPSLDEDGNWLDTSLAMQCMNIFELYFTPDLLMYDLILTSFMFKFKPNTAKFHLKRFQLSNYIGKMPAKIISLLYYSAENHNIDLSFISYPKPAINKLSMFNIVDEISDLIKSDIFDVDLEKMATKLVSIYSTNNKTERKFISTLDPKIGSLSFDLKILLNYKNSELLLEMLNIWRQMWNEMTLKRGNWEHSAIAADSCNHWKRSSLLFYTPALQSNFPGKMALNNFDYDDHLEASFARDLGSFEEAQNKAQIYRNQTKKISIIDSTLKPKISKNKESWLQFNPKYYAQCLNKGCLFKEKAVRITPQGLTNGFFEIYNGQFVLNRKPILFADIRKIFLKTRLHHPTAFEIYKKDGKSFLVDIPNFDNSRLISYFQPFMPKYPIEHYTEKWMNYEISNFEYLMRLNEFSYRSFNDLSAYPIMPWVLSDYQSESLDLKNSSIYRDLSKPIGALNPERLEKLRATSLTITDNIPHYLYQSGYMTQMGVLSYLVRIEPFTSIHVKYQGGKFEYNTKIFKSIDQSYKNVTKLMNDFKELIPEFYTTPEFLINSEGFLIGDDNSNQNDLNTENMFEDNVQKYPGSVELPKWANSSALKFVYMNRKALESNHVSEHINDWIDLIWGYKQRGYAASQADNTFYPFMYSDVWDKLKEGQLKIEEKHIESILSDVGQIPTQLFSKPHLQRNCAEKATFFTRPDIIKGETKFPIKGFQLLTSCFTSAVIKPSQSGSRPPPASNETNALPVNNSNRNSVKYTKAAYNSRQKQNQLIAEMIPQQKETSAVGLAKTQCGKFVCITIRTTSSPVFITTFDFSAMGKIVDDNGEPLYYDIISPSFLFFAVENGHAFKLYFPFKKLTASSSTIGYRIKHAAFSDKTIVTAGDTSFSVWNFDQLKDPLFTLPTYRSKIQCIEISCAFDLVICGMTDGALQFTSINRKQTLKIIDLGDVISMKIKISPGWGFVVVYCESNINDEKYLMFFTSNGMKFKELKIPNNESISAMEVYKSRDGFDYLVIATEKGRMHHFEIFFAAFDKPFYTASFLVKSISFVAKQNAIYCTGDSNTILVLPSPSF